MSGPSSSAEHVTTARPSAAAQTVARGVEPVATPSPKPKTDVPISHHVRLQTTVEPRSFIAEGGMATVYRAHDHTLGREIAMKVLKPGAPQVMRDSFEYEARLMARLDHPGIVGVYGLSRPDDAAQIFTMKLVEGRTLQDIVHEDGLPRGAALAVILRAVLRMCETLAYAHDHGVIHRDLKPANVMLGRYGECYIMDWGVALALQPGSAGTGWAPGEIVGTPAYMAPEQAHGDGRAIDARTDVYGLGGLLYFVLCGRPPHNDDSIAGALAAAKHGRVTPPELHCPDRPIPARLGDIVLRALEPAPEDRFDSMMQLHAALERFLFTGEWFTRLRFGPGELVVREGERGDRAYIVESGRCEVFRAGEQGEVSLREIGPGEVIGELALFTAGARTASIRARTPMTLLELSREALEQELPAGSWTRQIIDTLALRFISVDQAWESARSTPSGRFDDAQPDTPAPRPPRLEPITARYVAEIMGAIVGLVVAGMLLLVLVSVLIG